MINDNALFREPHGFEPPRLAKIHAAKPMNVTLAKGSVHVAVQRGFVDFVLHKSQAFINWLKPSEVPDETLFPSLNSSPQLGVPGAYTGKTT